MTADRMQRRSGRRGKAWLALLLVILLSGCFSFQPGVDRTGWAFQDTGLDALQGRGFDGGGIRVAIIDTGIDPSHPALDGARIVAWRDVPHGRPDPYDRDGHGTYVAGLVAGQGRLRGGAPGVDLIVVKVFDDSTRASDTWVAAGIRFAVDQNADVIGLSLGGGSFPILGTQAEDATRAAVARGVLVVAAAGNDGPDNGDVSSPANVAGAIAVAAVDRDRRVADFSSRGSASSGILLPGVIGTRSAPDQKPEISAPGVDINGPYPDGQYVSASGTSSAVPFVVSALALMQDANPRANPSDEAGVTRVKQWLMESAAPVPGATRPHDRAAGYGFLDAVALEARARSSA
jgi:subtilisin family serine protease